MREDDRAEAAAARGQTQTATRPHLAVLFASLGILPRCALALQGLTKWRRDATAPVGEVHGFHRLVMRVPLFPRPSGPRTLIVCRADSRFIFLSQRMTNGCDARRYPQAKPSWHARSRLAPLTSVWSGLGPAWRPVSTRSPVLITVSVPAKRDACACSTQSSPEAGPRARPHFGSLGPVEAQGGPPTSSPAILIPVAGLALRVAAELQRALLGAHGAPRRLPLAPLSSTPLSSLRASFSSPLLSPELSLLSYIVLHRNPSPWSSSSMRTVPRPRPSTIGACTLPRVWLVRSCSFHLRFPPTCTDRPLAPLPLAAFAGEPPFFAPALRPDLR